MTPPSIMVVAGEVSGDIHGGNLLERLTELAPDLQAFGVGGDRLAAAGLECLERSETLSHMGLAEVARELPRIRRVLHRLIDESRRRKPRAAVLIDSPDFNLRLARRLTRQGIPVILYVSPQLWAWRRGRVRTIRRRAREVLCILPFEEQFYRAHGVPARFIGHPLVDDLAAEGLLAPCLEWSETRLALLPGSRAMEIRALLPSMLEGLRALEPGEVDEAVLIEAPGAAGVIDEVIEEFGGDGRLRRVGGAERRQVLGSCGFAWTASGTATLECALLDVPMIVGYRLHPATFLAARMLVRVPHVALVNLIAGTDVAPELIQGNWTAEQLIATTRRLGSPAARTDRRVLLAEVRRRLGQPGASRRAADAVLEYLR
jgi:lipid-A-disaccharide synthase